MNKIKAYGYLYELVNREDYVLTAADMLVILESSVRMGERLSHVDLISLAIRDFIYEYTYNFIEFYATVLEKQVKGELNSLGAMIMIETASKNLNRVYVNLIQTNKGLDSKISEEVIRLINKDLDALIVGKNGRRICNGHIIYTLAKKLPEVYKVFSVSQFLISLLQISVTGGPIPLTLCISDEIPESYVIPILTDIHTRSN